MPKLRRMTTISERLHTALKHAGFKTQMDLVRASGVPQGTVNRIFNGTIGKQGPETATIQKLADSCGVVFEWLASGKGPMIPTRQMSLPTLGPPERHRPDRPMLYPLFTPQSILNVPKSPERYVTCDLKLGPGGFALELTQEEIPTLSGAPDLWKFSVITAYAKAATEDDVLSGRFLVILRRVSNKVILRQLTKLEGVDFWESMNSLYPLRFKQRDPGDRVIGVVLKIDMVMNYAK